MCARPSSPALLFLNPLARIVQEPAHTIGLLWQAGPRDLRQVQAVFRQLLRAQQQSGSQKLLIDESRAGLFSEDAKHWLVEEWLPGLTCGGGFRHAACVLAHDVFARLSAVPLLAASQRLHMPYRSFADEPAARHWLGQR